MQAHCRIEGRFKEDSLKALKVAQSMGAFGGCSNEEMQDPNSNDTWDTIPVTDGGISFSLFGRAPFDKLHKIAKAICEPETYEVSIIEW